MAEPAPPMSGPEFFMNLAVLAARRSSHPRDKRGACIVSSSGDLVSSGFATPAPGFTWDDATPATTCSAELSAIISAGTAARGGQLYCSTAPSASAAVAIAAAKLAVVIFHQPAPEADDAAMAQNILAKARIGVKQFGSQSAEKPAAKPASTPAATGTTEEQKPKAPANVPMPATPFDPKKLNLNFFAPEGAEAAKVVAMVMSAADGDFLIRINEKNERVLVVKDENIVRTYTMRPDGSGRWTFGNRAYPNMRSVVALLKRMPIKSKSGKMIQLGNPAPGGVSMDEPDDVGGDAPPELPSTPGGTVDEEGGCTVM